MSRKVTRRRALQQLAGWGAGAVLGLGRCEAQRQRPNILFILTDDQAWNVLGFTGRFPFLRTPHLDRLAREGAHFLNAFVTTSLCSPSRASFLTGCYAHRHGVRANEQRDIHPSIPTFPQVLQKAGYETAFIGKWHMRPVSDPRPGFDEWLSFRGQGEYVNPTLNQNGREFQQEGYMTDLLTDYALRWLRRPRRGPFCLLLWHKAVHGPFTPAPRHQNAFADAELPKPPNFDDTFAGKPRWLRRGAFYGQRREQWEQSEGKPIPDALPVGEWNPRNPAHLNYLRTLLAVDESVGQVLAALEEMGQLDNTFILFSSDNGFFLGEHRRGDKRLMYEESIRIPLLVRYPPLVRSGVRIEEMVLNIDVAPTLLELAGAPIPKTVQGRSFLPLLRGEKVEWRRSWLYEYFQEDWLPGVPTMLGVRTERWKYIRYPDLPGELEELYDLEKDPYELRNLAADPAYAEQLKALRGELERLLKETGYGEPLPRIEVKVPLELVLHYTFDQVKQGRVRDASGRGHEGVLTGGRPAQGRRGLAWAFDGHAFVEVPQRPATLSPEIKPFTVGGWCWPEANEGVLVAHGGRSHGYALYLRRGVPHFALRIGGNLALLKAPQAVPLKEWLHLAATLGSDLKMRLFVNGAQVAEGEAPDFVAANPNESLLVGADRGTLVGDYPEPLAWRGLIEEVRVYWGEMDEAQIRQWAGG